MDEVPGGVGCIEDVASGARRCWGLRWHGGARDGGGARGACRRLVARARGSRGGVGRANFVRPVDLAPSRSRRCLVQKKFCKIFQILHHIESLDVYMKY